MTIHDLDMARWLLGEEPVEITAHGSCLVDPAIGAAGDIDTAAVTLRTASGRIAQIANTRRAVFGYDQRIEVCGARGMLAAGNRESTSVERATAGGLRDRSRPALLPGALRRRLPPRARRVRAPPARRGRRHRLGRRRRARARDRRRLRQVAAHPHHRPAGDPCMKKLSRRPDRQRLHRPRALDRAAGSRRRVPGGRDARVRAARRPRRGPGGEIRGGHGIRAFDRRLARARRRSRGRHRRHLLAQLPAPRDGAGRHRGRQARLVREAARARRRRGAGSRRRRGPRRRRAPDRLQLFAEPADPPRAVDDRVRRASAR